MREELDNKLVEAFPHLYRDRSKSLYESCMGRGFETGDGWFQIIWDLSEALEKDILSLPEDQRQHYCAAQVKEKFGILRYYMTTSTTRMEELIQEAENKSAITCEVCGKPGSLQGTGWWYTACEEHTTEKKR